MSRAETLNPTAGAHSEPAQASCGACVHFEGSPLAVEGAYPGMRALGSGYSSVRDQDGICGRHGLYLSARDHCPQFERAERAVRDPLTTFEQAARQAAAAIPRLQESL